MMLNYIDWAVNPEMFTLFGRGVRWYGLLFGTGLLVFAPWIALRMWKHEGLNEAWYDKLYWTVVICAIVGARLGHCLFYDPLYYLSRPVEILKVWEGGFASHGGTIGIILGVWWFSAKVSKKPIVWALDRIAVPTGLAAAMIRLGNLMNSEIFGEPTTLPWGFKFHRSREWHDLCTQYGYEVACHPTAIYEALCYLAVFGICMWLYWKRDAARRRPGLLLGVFLTGTFVSRFFIEMLKLVQEPWELDLVAKIGLNQGQLLSIPFIIAGAVLTIHAFGKPAKEVAALPQTKKGNK